MGLGCALSLSCSSCSFLSAAAKERRQQLQPASCGRSCPRGWLSEEPGSLWLLSWLSHETGGCCCCAVSLSTDLTLPPGWGVGWGAAAEGSVLKARGVCGSQLSFLPSLSQRQPWLRETFGVRVWEGEGSPHPLATLTFQMPCAFGAGLERLPHLVRACKSPASHCPP